MEFSNFLDFLSSNLGLILGILGLLYTLIKVFGPRKTTGTPEAHLSKADIEGAEAAGERAREDVRTRYGKYFGRGNP